MKLLIKRLLNNVLFFQKGVISIEASDDDDDDAQKYPIMLLALLVTYKTGACIRILPACHFTLHINYII